MPGLWRLPAAALCVAAATHAAEPGDLQRNLLLDMDGADSSSVGLLQLTQAFVLPREPPGPSLTSFWSGKNGDLARTGASDFVAPSNLSAGPDWSFHDDHDDLVRAAALIDGEKNIYLATIAGYIHKMSPTGQKIWTHGATASIPMVPALVGESIFAASVDGNVFALNTTNGNLIWRTQLTPCSAGDTWSVTATDELVVVAADDAPNCQVNTLVIALTARAGAVVWRYKPDLPVYNFLSAAVNGSLVFSDSTGRVYRLDLNTGREIWKFADTNPTDFTTGGAVVGPPCPYSSDRGVYVTSNVGNHNSVNHAGGSGRLSVFSFLTGERLWYRDIEFQANNAPAVGSLHPSGTGSLSVVVGVGENPGVPPQRSGRKEGKVVAFDAETGERLDWAYNPPTWNFVAAAGDTIVPLHICLPDSFSNPAIGGDGTVYIGFEDGRLYAIRDADGDGRIAESEVSSFDTHNAFQGSPAIAPGMLVATPCNGMHVFTL